MLHTRTILIPRLFIAFAMLVALFAATMVLPSSSAVAQCTQESSGQECVNQAIAGANDGEEDINLSVGFGFTTLSQAINTIISLIFLGAGLLAFFFILMGAFNYLTAGDDSSKTEKARKQITNAVIGLILVALVYVIWLIAINLVPGLSDFFVTDGQSSVEDCIAAGTPPAECYE